MGEIIFPTIAAPRDPLSKRDGPWEFAGGKRVFPLAPVSVGKVLLPSQLFFYSYGVFNCKSITISIRTPEGQPCKTSPINNRNLGIRVLRGNVYTSEGICFASCCVCHELVHR